MASPIHEPRIRGRRCKILMFLMALVFAMKNLKLMPPEEEVAENNFVVNDVKHTKVFKPKKILKVKPSKAKVEVTSWDDPAKADNIIKRWLKLRSEKEASKDPSEMARLFGERKDF